MPWENPINDLRVIPSWVASQPSQLRDRDAHVSGGEECNEGSIFYAKLQLSTLAKTTAFARQMPNASYPNSKGFR